MPKTIDLLSLNEEALLKLRLCDLPLRIEGTWLEERVRELHGELNAHGITFKPECYLADEWLTPDGEPVIGIPFYLAHPVLTKLEKKMMLEAEGSTRSWCMRLLRHEAGHALNYAYKLYRRRKWQKIFGRFSQEYGDTYRFRPYSKNFVRHLENYYAQYHPDEDFAETFAVWLTPGSNWRQRYKGWKAMVKLNYVDALMNEIKSKAPTSGKGKRYWEARHMRTTLKNFYKKKMHSYAENFPDFHDANLKKVFQGNEKGTLIRDEKKEYIFAASLLRRHKKTILNNVALWTGEKKYIIGDLIDTLVDRCKALHLNIEADNEPEALLKITSYITTSVMNYLYTGGFTRER